ncbi:head outer capsid protein [Shigella phage vB_SdyM_006]|nr:head outer capsid protein [Shigella phage vB_SdyM_006]QQV89533.1 head outer capsid protein [Proteus phage SJ_PmiM]
MSIVLKLTPENPKITIGESQEFTMTTENQTDETLKYEWYINEDIYEATNKNMTYTPDKSGEFIIKCKVSSLGLEGETVLGEESTTLTVNLKTITDLTTNITGPKEAEYGEEFELVVNAETTAESPKYTYKWSSGETTKKIKVIESEEGEKTFTCTVTCKSTNYEPATSTSEHKVSISKPVVPEPDPSCESCRYIHPLDHRESAYLWVGYWVLEEIEKAVEEGIDWKKPDDTDLKYKCDLKTLAFMLEKYPNVDVQESRNGYILSKDDIENGVIY